MKGVSERAACRWAGCVRGSRLQSAREGVRGGSSRCPHLRAVGGLAAFVDNPQMITSYQCLQASTGFFSLSRCRLAGVEQCPGGIVCGDHFARAHKLQEINTSLDRAAAFVVIAEQLIWAHL